MSHKSQPLYHYSSISTTAPKDFSISFMMVSSHQGPNYPKKWKKASLSLSTSILSSFLACVLFSALLVSARSAGSVPQEEISGLHSLYLSNNGKFWSFRSPFLWDFTQDVAGVYLKNPCYIDLYASPWEGLSCTGEDPTLGCDAQICHVTSVEFYYFNLTNQLPSELSKISQLQTLIILGNSLTGEVPASIGDLTELVEIDFGFNALSSTIPDSFSNLVKLSSLTLWENQMSGHIPPSIGNLINLERIDVEANMFSGHLPSTIGQLNKLKAMWFTGNSISGHLSEKIGSASNLEKLGMHGNMFSGPVPPQVGNLSKLQYLDFAENYLTGSLPIEISGLVNVGELWLNLNALTGCIPPLSALEQMHTLALSSNHFGCSLPEDMVNLTNLEYMHLNDNDLTGVIPHDFGNLAIISSLGLYQNKLTGTIPSSMGWMLHMNYLGIFDNLLSGTISTSFGLLKELIYLGAGDNHLSGTIPTELCQMLSLETFEYPSNQLTGTLPVCLGSLNTHIISIALEENQLSGEIPSSFGNLSHVRSLVLASNQLSGQIPPEIGNMTDMVIFDVHSNVFTGSIPDAFSELENLEKINMAGNLLSGALDNALNASLQVNVLVLDLSNNKLSGDLPDNIFQLPLIETIALSVNCFGGSLPESMCDAHDIEVLSMDGLGAAQGCKNRVAVPISGVALFNFMDGTIPKCIWDFTNVRVVHFSGNGLGGTLETLSNVSVLEHLGLAHNQLSGTIPYSVRSVHHLDISYNQMTGDVRNLNLLFNDSGLDLHVNRLSGHVSGQMQFVEELRILEGNIFACDGNVPENDEYYNKFICGSKTLDGSLYGMLFLCSVCTFIYLCRNIFKQELFSKLGPRFAKFHYRAARQKYFAGHLKRVESFFAAQYSQLSSIVLFGRKLHAVWVFILRIAVLIFVLGIPIYILKRSEELSGEQYYLTHTITYRWFWTFAYISGQLPAILILLAWMIVITVFFTYFMWIFPLKTTYNNKKSFKNSIRERLTSIALVASEKESPSVPTKAKLKLFVAVVLNITIIVIINAVYIYSSDRDLDANIHLVIQFAFAVFNVMYGLVVLPVFASPLEDEMTNINFRLWLLKFNNLLVPCVVTFLSSSSCLQGLLIESDPIVSHYSHEVCDFWYYADISQEGGRTCGQFSMHDVDVVPLIPPYIYHYQCGSVFLTLYIPVYIYMYSFQLLIPLIYMMLLSLMEYETIPSAIRPMVPAIIWPKYLLKQHQLFNAHRKQSVCEDEETENMSVRLSAADESSRADYDNFLAALKANPSMLFNAKTIITFDILHNISVLFTFGLCSPFLTVIISMAMILKINMWLVLMGRFLNFFDFEEENIVRVGGDMKRQSSISSVYLDDTNTKISQHKEQIEVKKNNIHPALLALSLVCIPLEDVFRKSVWPVTWTSAAFFAFLCWDLSADKVGWKNAIWIPALALSFPIFMWITTKIFNYWGSKCGGIFVQQRESSLASMSHDLKKDVELVDREQGGGGV